MQGTDTDILLLTASVKCNILWFQYIFYMYIEYIYFRSVGSARYESTCAIDLN